VIPTGKPAPNPVPVVTPRRRAFRTALQVTVAVLGAIPAAIALTPLDADHAVAVVGITGALVILISVGQNAYDQAQINSKEQA
jgi:hypothetical protein